MSDNYPDDMGSKSSDFTDPRSPLYTGDTPVNTNKTEDALRIAIASAKGISIDGTNYKVDEFDEDEMYRDSISTCVWLEDVDDPEAHPECFGFDDIVDAHTHGIIRFYDNDFNEIVVEYAFDELDFDN